MKKNTVQVNLPAAAARYEIVIGHGLLDHAGKWARRCLGKQVKRLILISNPLVFELYGSDTIASLRTASFEIEHFLIGDGEEYKSWETAEKTLDFLASSNLTRSDAVVALGGGVVGDVAGFVSAIHLRGVAFLQIPTTLLSMIDSSVGGKTGVNSNFGKNLIGAFHQPRGVLIDTATLCTLHHREITAGFCEAIKHGAIGGSKLLDPIGEIVSHFAVTEMSQLSTNKEFHNRIGEIISAQVEFKAAIVIGDERESTLRADNRSRKILNFGHTLAHALEAVTDYKYFRHGEAVGYGVLFAAELSKSLALCSKKDVELLNDVVQRVGVLPTLSGIDPGEVQKAFRLDKKNISGSLQMILLKGIGKPVIVSEQNIPLSELTKALEKFFEKWA